MKHQNSWITLLFVAFMPFSLLAQQIAGVKPANPVRVARITGLSLPGENIPNSNNTVERYDIGGTDLGIAWRMGNGQTGFWFGDTYGADWKPAKEGGPGNAGNWRSNVVGFSSDYDLSDGITFQSMVNTQIIPSPHITDGTGNHTTIPTAAIHANGKDYVHYMEVRKWAEPGNWFTNKSGMYSSVNNGLSWTECKSVNFSGTSNFAQAAYAKKNGYVYIMGTISGRSGAIYLSRVKEREIEDQSKYAYFNKNSGWVKGQESEASILIPAPAGELSLLWHSDFKQWIITYLDVQKHEIVMRSAKSITGPWSETQTLVKTSDYPGLYGAFIHPASSSGTQLYFLISIWPAYNVFLMKADLSSH